MAIPRPSYLEIYQSINPITCIEFNIYKTTLEKLYIYRNNKRCMQKIHTLWCTLSIHAAFVGWFICLQRKEHALQCHCQSQHFDHLCYLSRSLTILLQSLISPIHYFSSHMHFFHSPKYQLSF